MTAANDEEFIRQCRHNVLNVLELWASKDEQLKYQQNVPIADVSAELFCQWSDDFYHPEWDRFNEAFTKEEQVHLAAFDQVINEIADQTPTFLPPITDFVKSNEWQRVNKAALDALKKLRKS